MSNSGLGAFVAVAAIFGVVGLLLGVAAYVLMALGLMKLAENKGIENAWLAWIPIANLYIFGLILGELNIFGQDIPKLELVMPLAPIAVMILNFIPILGQLISIAYAVFMIMALYNLFKMYRPESAVLFTVLSCIGLAPIFIFIIRNDTAIQL